MVREECTYLKELWLFKYTSVLLPSSSAPPFSFQLSYFFCCSLLKCFGALCQFLEGKTSACLSVHTPETLCLFLILIARGLAAHNTTMYSPVSWLFSVRTAPQVPTFCLDFGDASNQKENILNLWAVLLSERTPWLSVWYVTTAGSWWVWSLRLLQSEQHLSQKREGHLFPSHCVVLWGGSCLFDPFYFHRCCDQTSVVFWGINLRCLSAAVY